MEQDQYTQSDIPQKPKESNQDTTSRLLEDVHSARQQKPVATGSDTSTEAGNRRLSGQDQLPTPTQITESTKPNSTRGDSQARSIDSAETPTQISAERAWSSGDTIAKYFKSGVTAEDRTEAKKKLDGHVSELIPEADRKTLSEIHNAIANGDVDALSKAIQTFNNQPEKLKAFMKEVEKNLKAEGADGHVAVSKEGKVLLYSSYGSTAVELGTDGSVGVRPVSTRMDGSAVLEPGEVLNKEPKDCMKDVCDSIVGGMTRPHFGNIIKEWPDDHHPIPRLEPMPWPKKPSIIDQDPPEWPKPYYPKPVPMPSWPSDRRPTIIEPLNEGKFVPKNMPYLQKEGTGLSRQPEKLPETWLDKNN